MIMVMTLRMNYCLVAERFDEDNGALHGAEDARASASTRGRKACRDWPVSAEENHIFMFTFISRRLVKLTRRKES